MNPVGVQRVDPVVVAREGPVPDAVGMVVDATRPTMKDVAELAGVGLKTVSRVVNREGYVSTETAARVEAAIAQIGYRRNEIARSMRPGVASTDLGLLLGDLRNPFFAAVASAVMSEARGRGLGVVMTSADEDPSVERAAIDGLLGRRVAGLLIVPGSNDYSFLQKEMELGTPVVFIDRPGPGLQADEILIDNANGARLAVQHLVAAGFRRISILVAPSRYSTGERLRGYRDVMRRNFGSVDDSLIRKLGRGSREEAERAARELLAMRRPPDAFFTTTDYVTQGLLRALDGRSDIGIVGFDDFPLADLLPTPITVVSGDPTTLGTLAVQTLFERLEGDTGSPRRQIVHPQLIVRGSGERPAGKRSPARRPTAPARRPRG
jgi:LacI family transcriptional regulator